MHKNKMYDYIVVTTNVFTYVHLFQMEGLVREMKDEETGVRVKSQKLFLTSIPSAFAGTYILLIYIIIIITDHYVHTKTCFMNVKNRQCDKNCVFWY